MWGLAVFLAIFAGLLHYLAKQNCTIPLEVAITGSISLCGVGAVSWCILRGYDAIDGKNNQIPFFNDGLMKFFAFFGGFVGLCGLFGMRHVADPDFADSLNTQMHWVSVFSSFIVTGIGWCLFYCAVTPPSKMVDMDHETKSRTA